MEAKLLFAAPSVVLCSGGFSCCRKISLFMKPACCSRRISVSGTIQTSDLSLGSVQRSRVDESENYKLEGIRHSLIRQEDSIIFSLVERSMFCHNAIAYHSDAFTMDGFHGSMAEYIIRETESLQAKVGRYSSPDENPFFPENLPQSLLPPLEFPKVLHPRAGSINFNPLIWDMYFQSVLPTLVKDGDDGDYSSAAICDTVCLQVLSRRIHYGKFVAEAKFQNDPVLYKPAIRAQDASKLMDLLTYPDVEAMVVRRVEVKSQKFGQEVSVNQDKFKSEPAYRINPSFVAQIYKEWVMPLTKQVQVKYLLRRLD